MAYDERRERIAVVWLALVVCALVLITAVRLYDVRQRVTPAPSSLTGARTFSTTQIAAPAATRESADPSVAADAEAAVARPDAAR